MAGASLLGGLAAHGPGRRLLVRRGHRRLSGGRRPGWRPVRIRAQATGGGQGQRASDPRPWRAARPDRRAGVRGAGLRRPGLARPAGGRGTVTVREPPSAERPRRITVLGATGSIGRSTLALVAEAPENYRVEAVTGFRRVDALAAIARDLRRQAGGDRRSEPAMRDAEGALWRAAASRRRRARRRWKRRRCGRPSGSWPGSSVPRACGRPWPRCGAAPWWRWPTRNAWSAPATCSCARCGAMAPMLLPVDSEHNAIWQALAGSDRRRRAAPDPDRLGRAVPPLEPAEMARATPAQAVAHPKWSMGAKISVDSATMMNKGLEIIEAHHLFGVPGACDRGGGPSAVDRAQPGRVQRRLDAGAARRARHAHPDRLRAGLAGAARHHAHPSSTCAPAPAWSSSRRMRERFPACGWRGSPCGRAGRHLLF